MSRLSSRQRRLFDRSTGVFLLLLLSGLVLMGTSVHAQEYAFQQTIPSGSDNRYDEPTDVAFSVEDSTIYVADEGAEAVFRYDLDGTRRPPLRSV